MTPSPHPLWRKAQDAAGAARLLLAGGFADAATGRAYYAMFNAARAVLQAREGVDPAGIKRHATVLNLVAERLVRPGLLAPDLGTALRRAEQERGAADYALAAIEPEAAAAILSDMERFLARVAQLLGEPAP